MTNRKRSTRKRQAWRLDGPTVLDMARTAEDTQRCWCGYSVTAEAVVAAWRMSRHLASDPRHVQQLTAVEHHISTRITCDGCTTRVFTFAAEVDAAGRVTGRHYCAPCAARINSHHSKPAG